MGLAGITEKRTKSNIEYTKTKVLQGLLVIVRNLSLSIDGGSRCKPTGAGCVPAAWPEVGTKAGLPMMFGDPSAHGKAGPGAKLWQGKVSGFAFSVCNSPLL